MPSVPGGPEQQPSTENARKIFLTLHLTLPLPAVLASSSALSLPCFPRFWIQEMAPGHSTTHKGGAQEGRQGQAGCEVGRREHSMGCPAGRLQESAGVAQDECNTNE